MDISPFLISSTPYLTAFLTGLFGGVHCVGMCGGIAAAMMHGLPAEVRAKTSSMLPYAIAYNVGRISSYTVAGAIVGYLGYSAGTLVQEYSGWFYLRIVAGMFMIILGLYLGGWWFGLQRLEQLGGLLWQRVSGLANSLLPLHNPGQAFALGLLWGWLPCGLVYSMLVFSFAAGGWMEGGAFMLSFGLGTLPALLGVGLLAGKASKFLQHPRIRHLAGALVIGFGIWTITATLLVQANVGLGCAVPVQ
jgi:sulfite exporter TauE/SafE